LPNKKRVTILGSTGSIGTQALDVIARYPERFEVAGLAAGRRVDDVREQARRFGVEHVATAADGPEALVRVAVDSRPDIVLAATDGFVAFDAVFAAVERGIDIAVANKELIVAAGELLMARAGASGSAILPVDSEHSAIFQCLVGESPERVRAIILTASGGPFRSASREEMERASVAQALAHPTWQMGVKNTVDSATMMNKGLEVIEASRLFGLPAGRVQVVVHPQSIAHGFVVFSDGSVKAQLAAPDMRLPIGYALSFPDRLGGVEEPEDPIEAIGGAASRAGLDYRFEPPDFERFPCLRLAYEALEAGGTAPAVLSAANEIAVEAFVEGAVPLTGIARIIEQTLVAVDPRPATLETIREDDRRAREAARTFAGRQRIEV
jgi:1-deoxy-D-xylulose-5-phosphate reductoisomerase